MAEVVHESECAALDTEVPPGEKKDAAVCTVSVTAAPVEGVEDAGRADASDSSVPHERARNGDVPGGVREDAASTKTEGDAVADGGDTLSFGGGSHRRSLSDVSPDKHASTPEERTLVWRGHKRSSSTDINVGSLLRFFKSDFFNTWIGVSYLHRYTNGGIHDYLCNRLYGMPVDEIEYYLVQLVNMMVHVPLESKSLERFIMDKCSKSVHFALQVSWLLQAAVEDNAIHRERCFRLQELVEVATVNCERPMPVEALAVVAQANFSVAQAALGISAKPSENGTEGNCDAADAADAADGGDAGGCIDDGNGDCKVSESDESGAAEKVMRSQQLPHMIPHSTNESLDFALSKMDRCEYFNKVLDFVEELGRISDSLRAVPMHERQEGLQNKIKVINTCLPIGLYLPLWPASRKHYCIVQLAADESLVLKSKERVPFIVYFELIEGSASCSSEDLHEIASSYSSTLDGVSKAGSAEDVRSLEGGMPEDESEGRTEPKPAEDSADAVGDVDEAKDEDGGDGGAGDGENSEEQETAEEEVDEKKRSPFGEPYAERKERIRDTSPYGHLPSWNLASVIVKYGDDCRQEQLAMQLISQFKQIFDEAQLPLWLRPYRILVTSASSGLIETLFDAVSLHGLKKFYAKEDTSLKYHFKHQYGDEDSYEYKIALRNFTESLAAYSLLTYILQIKDRHNGNIMIDAEGHLIHIDFGFMLSNSPGGVNAESSHFKLAADWVDLLGGVDSASFQYFKVLMIKGYMEIRKHCDKITNLVDMMSMGSQLPCFRAGAGTAEMLRQRFNMGMTEEEVVQFVETMVAESHASWRTQIYDHFQYITNGIMS